MDTLEKMPRESMLVEERFWSYFTAWKDSTGVFYGTKETEATFWDLRYPSVQRANLNSHELEEKLDIVVSKAIYCDLRISGMKLIEG